MPQIEEKKTNFLEELKQSRDKYLCSNPPKVVAQNINFGKRDITKILKETASTRKVATDEKYNNNFISYKDSIKSSDTTSRIITLKDINSQSRPTNSFSSTSSSSSYKANSSAKDDFIGKRCLELTNEFRKRNNLPALKWDDEIWRICFTHSKNMGEKKVPFSHQGFKERINSLNFSFRGAYENVFYCGGYDSDISELGVNGWINSPGHRKNLLSNSSHCAIATYQNQNGEYYLTQIFINK